MDQISIALKEFGFGTQIYAREDAYGLEIENIISIYVESGIPIIAAIENDLVGHAILLVGHENDDLVDLKKAPRRDIDYDGILRKYVDYGDLQKRFIVNDDNLTPYTSTTLGDPAEHYLNKDDGFLGCTITSIVVPLHKKIYLEALEAKQLTLEILSDRDFGYEFKQEFVMRFFLTSSRSFKFHIACMEGFSKDLKDKIIGCKMPKFIWCGEFYSEGNFKKNVANALIIIDATEADDVWIDSLLFAGYPDRCYAKFEKGLVNLPSKFKGYSKFISNLH
ncbi:MAG TPA: hypothetical protein VK588_17105 [Chitinophagaceae bacterium]|nr:hypothetical protein [Chitinophagaceae bacterium]